MSSNVRDGKLVAVSPSMLNTFDPLSSFGCARKGYFKYVLGLEEPSTGKQELGTQLHALIEHRLTTGVRPSGEGEALGLYLAGEKIIERVAARAIVGVEQALPPFILVGVKLKGFVDVITEDGIVDWKTTSDINRYGKTAEDLTTDLQMLLYARACHPLLDEVKLAHGQFQTRGARRAEFVEVSVTQKAIDTQLDKVIIPLVERVKSIVAEPSVSDVDPDYRKCQMCAFRAQCPKEGTSAIMSFFSKMSPKIGTTPQTEAETVAVLTESLAIIEAAKVTPPDAPASVPELAADPVKVTPEEEVALQAIVEPKKERKVRAPKATAPDRPANVTIPIVEVTFTTVTVSKGVTINVGSFNSVRFDVSTTAAGPDFETCYRAAYAACTAKLDEEAEKYEAETGKGKYENAKGVVSK